MLVGKIANFKTGRARWRATVHYRTDGGLLDVEHWLEELGDIHDLVERGPHWDSIARIEIERVNHCDSSTLTVEQALRL